MDNTHASSVNTDTYWPLYERILGEGGSDERSSDIAESLESFIDGIVNDPAYQNNATVNGVVTPIVASRKSTTVCDVKAVPDTDIHIGDIVRCYDETWIVVELYYDKLGIINATMWLCNNILRFQNNSEAINLRDCVVDDGTYSKQSSDPDAFVLQNTYKIYLSIDEKSRKLFVDKRLALGQIFSSSGELILEVYKIIGMDIFSRNFGSGSHLMVLTVQRDIYNQSTDSLRWLICDIYKPINSDTSTEAVAGSCTISGRDTIRIGGANKKYQASFYDASGQEVSVEDADIVWAVDAPLGVYYTTNGSVCTILSVPMDENYVGGTITITVSDAGGLYGSFYKKVQVIAVG